LTSFEVTSRRFGPRAWKRFIRSGFGPTIRTQYAVEWE
jgi:hypothetical protein